MTSSSSPFASSQPATSSNVTGGIVGDPSTGGEASVASDCDRDGAAGASVWNVLDFAGGVASSPRPLVRRTRNIRLPTTTNAAAAIINSPESGPLPGMGPGVCTAWGAMQPAVAKRAECFDSLVRRLSQLDLRPAAGDRPGAQLRRGGGDRCRCAVRAVLSPVGAMMARTSPASALRIRSDRVQVSVYVISGSTSGAAVDGRQTEYADRGDREAQDHEEERQCAVDGPDQSLHFVSAWDRRLGGRHGCLPEPLLCHHRDPSAP